MVPGFDMAATKAWHCSQCGARNVTAASDVFSDQCRHCTEYNKLDWSDTADLSLSEAKAAADRVEAE